MVQFSIIICTYNRSQLLGETLDSLLSVLTSTYSFEILVIDNQSPDDTAEVISIYVDKKDSNVYYFLETNQGLSYARNRGIREAKGEILVFFDDDIEIDSKYFKTCSELFQEGSVNIVGGKVLPHNVDIPSWLPTDYYYLASIFDLGDKTFQVNKIMGANYVMRKEVAMRVGWYNPEFGRVGDKLTGGEEIDYINRAIDLGYIVLYSHKLKVYHKINSKLNKMYILEQTYNTGKADFLIDYEKNKLKVLAKLVRSMRDIILSLRVSTSTTFITLIRQKYALGYYNQARNKI